MVGMVFLLFDIVVEMVIEKAYMDLVDLGNSGILSLLPWRK